MEEGNIRGASLNPIYSQLRNAQDLNVGEVNTFTDWSVEAGDVVTVTRDGQEYKMPVHNQKTNWNKQQRVMISATGNEKRESITKVSQKKARGGGSVLQSTQNTYQHIVTSYNEMKAGLELASSSAALYVENKYSQMKAGLDLTSSSAALYVENKYSEMKAGLDLTSSSAALYVENKYSQMKAGLDLTSSSAALYVENKYSQMKSGLDMTSSAAALYVENKYTQMKAGLDLTSSTASLYVDNKYTQMKAGLDLTSSTASLYVDNKYTQMKAGLDLTSSTASVYVDSKYTQMKAGLDLTSSAASVYVDSKYTQMKAGLDLTSSTASVYVDNKYTQMKAGLDLTSSTAAVYVDNKYNQMKAGLDVTSSSAALYARSKENAAEIVARINEDGEGEIKLSADHVYIGNDKSSTVIAGKCKLSDVTADVINTRIASLATLQVQSIAASGTISASTLNGDNIYFRSGGGAGYTYANLKETFVSSVSLVDNGNNTYTLKSYDANANETVIGTFSKATGTSLDGQWVGGGVFKATASPQGKEVFTSLTGSVSRSGRTMTCHPYATINNSPTIYDTDKDLTGTITIAKSEVSASWEKYSGSGTPDADVQMPPISTNGWHIISVTVLGTTKKFRINITA